MPRLPRLPLLVASVLLSLGALEGVAATGAATAAPASGVRTLAHTSVAGISIAARKKKGKAKKPRRALKPQGFARRTVRAIPGQDRITVTWPKRLNATGYTVTWAPTQQRVPSSPAACSYPCKRIYTRYTSVTLTAQQLSTYGRTVSSRSGNTVRFKVFARNGNALRWTGTTYPYDAWVGPSRTADTNWLPTSNSQMAAPLAPTPGRTAAVASFNVLAANSSGPAWSSRAGKIVSQINNTGASVVATQENSNVSVGNTPQYQDLAHRLAPSGWALADDRNWDTTSGLKRSYSTQATRIYYRTAEWSRLDRGALMTHVPYGSATSGVTVDRWVSWVKLRSKADSATKMCVLDLHLLSNLSSNYTPWSQHRDAEIAQVLSELRSPTSNVRRVGTRVGAACDGVPTVIAGDFNAAQTHAPWGNKQQATLLSAGFVDTKNAPVQVYTRFSGPGPIGSWHAQWGTQIDYVLTLGMGGARTFKVNALSPASTGSDHYPVTAVVNVPQS